MKAIGLTGGIGSGKSTVARILQQMGYPVYIADIKASSLMNTHPEIRKALIKRFGAEIYTTENKINKPALAQLIFNDSKALADINGIVHPRVMEDFTQWSRKQKSKLIFFESAILFEAGLKDFFQQVLCVTAPESLRIARVLQRDQTTPEKIKERIRNQADDTFKCQQADFILYNDPDHLILVQLLNILKQLEK